MDQILGPSFFGMEESTNPYFPLGEYYISQAHLRDDGRTCINGTCLIKLRSFGIRVVRSMFLATRTPSFSRPERELQ